MSLNGGLVDALDEVFDEAVTQMCSGPTIELGCGPGRLVARLFERGIPALGIDRSATAIRLAGRGGAPALLGDVFEPLPGMGRWQTVLLVDGNVGLGGDPGRILGRAAELLRCGGRCVAEFEADAGRHPRALGAPGVGLRCRALVPVGIGRCGQRRHPRGASRSDIEQRSSGRRSSDCEPGRAIAACSPGFAARCAVPG